jgi:hypothetical protein
MDKQVNNPRREFVKKAVYLPPAILTLAVAPSYAKAGSEKRLPIRPGNGSLPPLRSILRRIIKKKLAQG